MKATLARLVIFVLSGLDFYLFLFSALKLCLLVIYGLVIVEQY